MSSRWYINLSVLVLCFLSSCSVKEDRTQCPCRLHLSCDELLISPELDLTLIAESYLAKETLRFDEREKMLMVPRCELQVIAMLGGYGAKVYNGLYNIDLGKQADSLYCSSLSCDCNQDNAYAVVGAKKQFATVYLHLMTGAASSPVRRIIVEGEVNGFDISGMSPTKGAFRCELAPDDFNSCSFRVPRQLDGSLRIIMIDSMGRESQFDAGVRIMESGYDWGKGDLSDILLDVDCVELETGIVINDWKVVEIAA